MIYYYLDVDDNTVFEQKYNYYDTIKRLGKRFVSRNSKDDSYKFVLLRKSWLQIYAILQEMGYDKLYEDDITRVADVVRKELKLD